MNVFFAFIPELKEKEKTFHSLLQLALQSTKPTFFRTRVFRGRSLASVLSSFVFRATPILEEKAIDIRMRFSLLVTDGISIIVLPLFFLLTLFVPANKIFFQETAFESRVEECEEKLQSGGRKDQFEIISPAWVMLCIKVYQPQLHASLH